jgi:heme exporter protein A
MMMKNENTLRAIDLTCSRQQHSLFSPVSFELTAGECLLIEGENGSGKTSLLRLLTGLSSPSQGEIYWENQAIQLARDDYTNQLHYVGHQNGLKLGLTVAENISLMESLSGNTNNQTTNASFFNVGLHTPANKLSAGQKRKLALLKLFLFPKKLWLLDEPLTALDATSQILFLEKLETHIQQGGMCIATSHQSLRFEKIKTKTLRLQAC